ncbi:major allergen Pru ar 1 [Ricinus communis]|uniref:Major allergen Pru ar, putative n=1 Tax=Ricinus communis TaxID=3988 RepID=B9S9Y1_RICCO|nr:major allergen Pru ar 1 [Ricinus communis]EEF39651.1 Major allergen Pru ar, putative [Ricinus communis]|eukprot:XP_002522800.1 major allergen Pru ar 1 [Ricinus communis]
MGVLTFEKEIKTAVPQATMFKVFVLESHTLIPKILPNISIEILEGNGGPGSIKKTSFTEGGDTKYIKTKVEALDKDNFTYSYTIIGGEPWSDNIEKVCYEIKILASPDGGSICKSSSKYYPKEGCQLDEEKIKTGAEKAFGMFKAIETHLLTNPDACN